MRTLLLLVWVGFNLLEQAWAQQDVLRIGPGVTPPKLIHKAEPEYSPEARDAHIQGTSVFEVVINEQGRAANITVLSPIGFGLDERAQTAIEKWRFVPGSKDRKPVKVLATIEVNFRFAGLGFDEKTEHERTKFNLALAAFKSQDSKRQERAVTTFEELARQEFPPAMYAFGTLLRTGQFVNKDVEQGRALIAKAADKNYGPAIYEVGAMYLEARQSPADVDKGIQLLRDAAVLGSKQAQYALATRYEAGDGLPRDQERARYFFRLCAAGGDVNCQFRLGKLLFELPDRRERDYLQAIAFLQLAAEQDVAQAKRIADAETARLNPEQLRWVNKLKGQLVRPQ